MLATASLPQARFVHASREKRYFTDIKSLFQKLYDDDADKVEQILDEIGRVGKGNLEAMKAVQDFLRKEKRMPLRIVAMQTISKIKINIFIMKKYSSRKAKKGKLAFRTPSRFIIQKCKKIWTVKIKRKNSKNSG